MVLPRIASSAPSNYVCPVCLGLQGKFNDETLLKKGDLVFSDDLVTVYINSFFVGKNAGSCIVVPNEHFENIYEMPDKYLHRVAEVSKDVAIVIKEAYRCDGITIRQNNEPAGDQHAFHYHMHVYPRYESDGYNNQDPADKRLASPDERVAFVVKIKNYQARHA